MCFIEKHYYNLFLLFAPGGPQPHLWGQSGQAEQAEALERRQTQISGRWKRRRAVALWCQRLGRTNDGVFSSQVLNGEVYPPTVKDVGADMHYPPHVPDSQRFAVGHEAFGLVPGLMMYATIWLREHNRVCDVLKEVHPDWDDERLFQTTRLVLIGMTFIFLSNV